MSLRPIGTEFWGMPCAMISSTDSRLRRFLYCVESHEPADDGFGNEIMGEVIKPIRQQVQECIGLNFTPHGTDHVYSGIWKDEEVR